MALKEDIQAATAALRAAKQAHGHDSPEAVAARLALAALIQQAKEIKNEQ
jgi:hypothetical protein